MERTEANRKALESFCNHFEVPDDIKKYLYSKTDGYWNLSDYIRWFRIHNYKRKYL